MGVSLSETLAQERAIRCGVGRGANGGNRGGCTMTSSHGVSYQHGRFSPAYPFKNIR
ncbi:MAG: hypothetical protein JWO28_2783 [Hyphomicrobiales bacterium]|nr:hypothetical protein [Hyphomicrobiales bacterium]